MSFGLLVAFLAFAGLKIKNRLAPEFLLQINLNIMKKKIKMSVLAFNLAFKKFFQPFSNFPIVLTSEMVEMNQV